MRVGSSSRPQQVPHGFRPVASAAANTATGLVPEAITFPSAKPIHWPSYWLSSWSRTAHSPPRSCASRDESDGRSPAEVRLPGLSSFASRLAGLAILSPAAASVECAVHRRAAAVPVGPAPSQLECCRTALPASVTGLLGLLRRVLTVPRAIERSMPRRLACIRLEAHADRAGELLAELRQPSWADPYGNRGCCEKRATFGTRYPLRMHPCVVVPDLIGLDWPPARLGIIYAESER